MKRYLLILLACGCSTIGDPGTMPEGLPHGGTGQFRPLLNDEVAIVGSLPGRAMFLRNDALASAQPVDGHLFYATAPPLDMPPMLPSDHASNEIYWPAFEVRRIHRGTSRVEGVGGFEAGGAVLMATEPWEDGEVFDPWVVVEEDGTARLYYAAAGGIGVAEAPSVDGAFTRLSATPIITNAWHPTVVRGPDGAYWMYYDTGFGIEAARSEDGISFTEMGPIILEGDDIGDGRELRVANPGAVTVSTRANRALIRLYFQSIRDGAVEGRVAHFFYVAGSSDGMTFVRHPSPVMESNDIRFPAPLLVDDRVSLLYGNLPFAAGPFLTRAVIVAVSPAGQSFLPPLEE